MTDPVGEDWSDDADTGGAATGTTDERGGLRQDGADRSATGMGGAIPSQTEPDGPRQPNA